MGKKDLKLWDVNDVGKWLQSINMNDYIDTFRINNVDGCVLINMKENELKNKLLGNNAPIGDGIKIWTAILKIKPVTKRWIRGKNKKKWAKWTDDDERKLKELYEKGKSMEEIGIIINRTTKAVYSRIRLLRIGKYAKKESCVVSNVVINDIKTMDDNIEQKQIKSIDDGHKKRRRDYKDYMDNNSETDDEPLHKRPKLSKINSNDSNNNDNDSDYSYHETNSLKSDRHDSDKNESVNMDINSDMDNSIHENEETTSITDDNIKNNDGIKSRLRDDNLSPKFDMGFIDGNRHPHNSQEGNQSQRIGNESKKIDPGMLQPMKAFNEIMKQEMKETLKQQVLPKYPPMYPNNNLSYPGIYPPNVTYPPPMYPNALPYQPIYPNNIPYNPINPINPPNPPYHGPYTQFPYHTRPGWY